MYYYAQYSPYGTNMYSHGDRLYRFTTRAARDSVVDSEQWDGSNWHWSAIDRDKARHWYPDAFRTIDYYDGWKPAEKFGGEMWENSATGGDYRYF